MDEYDKPILAVIEQPDQALALRDDLSGCDGVIKNRAAQAPLVFVTGGSRLSKGNLFSGRNNREDISRNPNLATICGDTDPDLDRNDIGGGRVAVPDWVSDDGR